MKNFLFFLSILLFISNNLVFGQHPDKWAGFEFDTLKQETGAINSKGGIYELKKDYTISLPEYFNDQSKMPAKTLVYVLPPIFDYRGNADFYHDWALNLPSCEWDFIRIEQGGILTIKKGYRWDGASNPITWMQHYNYRSSLVHDALYDLMRMGYLKPDENHWPTVGDLCVDGHVKWKTGDKNRAMADILHFMIAREDGDSWALAQFDFTVLRAGGGCKTHDNSLLNGWKYHVSDLAAYATNGKVELKWKRANEAGMNPSNESTDEYDILRNGQKIATVDRWMSTYYTDTDVSNNGSTYTYQIKESLENTDLYDWSNFKYSVPLSGAGNALKLDGINDYMEANTTSNDLCYENWFLSHSETMEAWVKPESQLGKSAILALNTISGGNYNILMYDGDNQQFCYYDDNISYVFTPDVYPINNWYHVAVTFEYKFGFNPIRKGTLYVNGQKQVSFTPSVIPKHGARFSIGQEWDNNLPTNFFKGCIDEVRIWNDVRTQNEIRENRYKPLRGDEDGLMALWHFNEPANATWFYTDDATVNDNIGNLLGYASTGTPFVPSGAMNSLPILFGVPADITVECDAVPPPANVTAENVAGGALEVIFSETRSNGPCANSYILIRTWTATDEGDNTISATQTITIIDTTVPVITGVPVESINQSNDEASCGVLVEYPEIVTTDNCSELVNLSFDPAPGTFLPVGIHSASVSVTDDCGNTNTASFDIIVTNENPIIESISATSVYSSRYGDVLFATASYADNNLSEAIWDWGDGTTSVGTINGQTISGEHRYQVHDDYILTLTITDLCGETSTKQYILTNNSDRAFVTGDGWFNSPENSFVFGNNTQDEAKFKFECRYNMYGETLRGKTIFSFNQDEYVFKSISYNYLIITDDKAVFYGNGSINRKKGFGFIISVIDCDLNDNHEEDRFRIKIWDETNGTVIYDNEMDVDEEFDATTVIGGGSIVIHNQDNENESVRYANTKSSFVSSGVTGADLGIYEVTNNKLIKIYPNPFSSFTEIEYSNPNNGKVDIRIYDMSGRIIKTLINETPQIGRQKVIWDGKNENGILVNNGIYFCRMVAGNHSETIKIIYVK